jgi:uncharacterized RDD family membrane protein YckC
MPTAPARPAPDSYAAPYQATALATAAEPSEEWAPAVPAATPQWTQAPRQARLFQDPEGGKVLQFPSAVKTHEPKPRVRRHASQTSDSQAYLDFLPPTPHAPRTLKTSVEAVIYCDAPVATPTHRAVGAALDFGMIGMAVGLFLLTFHLCGGEFEKLNIGIGLGFAGAFLSIALFYGLLWVLAASETAGQRWTGLRLINFDGSPIDRRERAVRFVAACLSFGSAALGVLWSLADEEGLTWHDHMSKTFPTIRT